MDDVTGWVVTDEIGCVSILAFSCYVKTGLGSYFMLHCWWFSLLFLRTWEYPGTVRVLPKEMLTILFIESTNGFALALGNCNAFLLLFALQLLLRPGTVDGWIFDGEREFLIQCSTLSNGGKETETWAQIILLIELKSVIFMEQISIDWKENGNLVEFVNSEPSTMHKQWFNSNGY